MTFIIGQHIEGAIDRINRQPGQELVFSVVYGIIINPSWARPSHALIARMDDKHVMISMRRIHPVDIKRTPMRTLPVVDINNWQAIGAPKPIDLQIPSARRVPDSSVASKAHASIYRLVEGQSVGACWTEVGHRGSARAHTRASVRALKPLPSCRGAVLL